MEKQTPNEQKGTFRGLNKKTKQKKTFALCVITSSERRESDGRLIKVYNGNIYLKKRNGQEKQNKTKSLSIIEKIEIKQHLRPNGLESLKGDKMICIYNVLIYLICKKSTLSVKFYL